MSNPLDRSAMYSALLDLSPEFRSMESRAGGRVITAALEAWYASDSAHMYKFAQWWLSEHDVTAIGDKS